MNQKLLYVGQRALNAVRMIKRGEFRKFVHVILVEIRLRLRKVPNSAYDDLTRCLPPSQRPTQLRLMPAPDMKADSKRIAEATRKILADIDIEEANDS